MRSQDKETLIKIENISIDSENYIIGNLISDDNKSICDYWRLGHYKAKERALEVLDEIQGKLNIRHCDGMGAEFIVLSEIVPIIYEMPKE